MNDYENYTIPAFMQDTHFRAWVLDGDPAATAFWQQWVNNHPTRQTDVWQAKELLENIWEGFNELSETELKEQLEAINSQLTNGSDSLVAISHPLKPTTFRRNWLVAAGVALALLGGWYSLNREQESTAAVSPYQVVIQQVGRSLKEVPNLTATPKQIRLPDGSLITLAPQSRLSYDVLPNGKKQRLVYLTGGAFFSVKRDPSRPFLVYANGIVTKVLGTSFSIQAYDGQPNIIVAVHSGRVSVFTPDKSTASTKNSPKSVFERLVNGIVLTANQQATYQGQTDHLMKTIVEQPVVVHPDRLPPQTVFIDAPVNQLFDQIEQAYSINIHYNKSDFKDCLLTAKFNDESLLDKINLICVSIGASYEIIDAQIFITGQGCK